MITETSIPVQTAGETATVFAHDYLNKITGERIERECKRQLDAGATTLVVDFSKTEMVNSIGVSILLGVIDAASNAGAKVVFSDVNDDTIELFDMLGLTNHVTVNYPQRRGDAEEEMKPQMHTNGHRFILIFCVNPCSSVDNF